MNIPKQTLVLLIRNMHLKSRTLENPELKQIKNETAIQDFSPSNSFVLSLRVSDCYIMALKIKPTNADFSIQ